MGNLNQRKKNQHSSLEKLRLMVTRMAKQGLDVITVSGHGTLERRVGKFMESRTNGRRNHREMSVVSMPIQPNQGLKLLLERSHSQRNS